MDRALAAALKALREPHAQAEAWARRLTQALGVVVKQVAAGGRGAARRGRAWRLVKTWVVAFLRSAGF